jgi:drug/metabolite transporter (DMT)-like permease
MANDDEGDGAWLARAGGATRNRPITWQGWLLMILYVIAVMGAAYLAIYGALAFLAALVLITCLFGAVIVRKSRLSARERLVRRN